MDDIAGTGQLEWRKAVLAEGSKGPIIAEAARLGVYRSKDGLPEENPIWLFARRDEDARTRFALSNAPEDIAFDDLCEASTMRWPIEQCFREEKDRIGMGRYEHRSSCSPMLSESGESIAETIISLCLVSSSPGFSSDKSAFTPDQAP